MTGRLLSSTLAGVVLLLTPAAARGQALERVPTPIDVRVTAVSAQETGSTPVPLVPRGAAVRISGTTVPLGSKGTKVRIEVKAPTGVVTTVNAPIGVDRQWSATFAGTGLTGRYAVSAFTADGKTSVATSFTVLADQEIETLGLELERELTKQASDTAAALRTVQSSLAATGPSPELDTVTANLAATSRVLAELPSRLNGARMTLAALGPIARRYPEGAHELEPITTSIQIGTGRLRQAADRIGRSAAAASLTQSTCDRIEAANEVLGGAARWFGLQRRLYREIVRLSTDNARADRIYDAAVPDGAREDMERFALEKSLNAVAAGFTEVPANTGATGSGGLADLVDRAQALLLDTVRVLGGATFDRLCERFSGPFNGTFTVDATVNGGQKLWGYITQLSGRITLRYEKPVKGVEPIAVSGQIEGHASFRMYEDLMSLNAVNRQHVIYRALIPPAGASEGSRGPIQAPESVGRMDAPGYFRVPITGTLQRDQLTITVSEAADTDFSDNLKGRVIYVVLAPAASAPYTMASTIPIQKAQFILSRGLRTTATIPLETKSHRKRVVKTAAESFERTDVVSNGEVTVGWKLELKACRPDCR